MHRTCRIADFGSGSVWITLAILAALLLETPHGGVSLADLAARPTHVLVRTPHGARLVADPWIADTCSAPIKGMRLRLKYELPTVQVIHTYEVRPRKDKRGVDLISDALPFGGLWYGEPDAISNAVGSVKFYSRSALLAFPL